MSDYMYSIFFEAENLSEDEIKRIRKYFQIKRQSGGGECGNVEKVRENVYKVAFLEQTAQERVLSKRDHAVSLPGGENLPILLSRHDIKVDKQVATESKTLEKILTMDKYLLLYLKENERAKLDMEKRLSSLSTHFKIDPDTEKAVVICDSDQTGKDDFDQQKWEAKVEKVFLELKNQYPVHYEIETEKKMLKLNAFSSSLTDDLAIYEEMNFSVIVGDITKMNNFLQVLNGLQEVSKECPVSKTQYTLVKEELEQMSSSFSGVTFTLKSPDYLVLNGLEKQIEAAWTKIQELVSQIQEKQIKLDSEVAKFLASSDAIQDYQTRFQQSLRSPVLLETVDSDLVLRSLSQGALQEAAAAVQRDLCVETVTLKQAEAQPPFVNTLKEALSRALQQANRGSPKVEVKYESESSFEPRMKVQLVGYSSEVSTLKDIIQEHQRNNAEFSDFLHLHLPEMVDNFSDIIKLIGLNTANVKLVPTSSPGTGVCVHLSGPRHLVEDLKMGLYSVFSCLIREKTEVDGPGVLQFFRTEFSKTQELLQTSFDVLILPQNLSQSCTAASRPRAWTSLPNMLPVVSNPQGTHEGCNISLQIVFKGVEEQKVDAIVAPMLNTQLTSTQVGKCLLRKARNALKGHFDAAKGQGLLSPGDVLQVDGTPVGCKKIFFIECSPSNETMDCHEKALHCGLKRALELCVQQSCRSVAMPVVGPGLALSVPVKVASDILTEVIGTFGLAGDTGFLNTLRIAIMPEFHEAEKIFQAVCTGLSTKMVNSSGQAVFHSLKSEIDDITIKLGTCELHLVLGDISNETTDAIVNTTDYNDLQTDVCNDILIVAGPQVQNDLTKAQVNRGEIFTTQPGQFHCKVIMHVCGERDTGVIKGLVQDIVKKCERDGHRSVAIPAICTGKGGLAASQAAKSILQGVKDATTGVNFRHLKTIRIILWKIKIFQEFKAVAQQIFGSFAQTTALPVPPLFSSPIAATRWHHPPSSSLDLHSLVQSLPVEETKAEFVVLGLKAENISKACHELRRAYETQCSSQSFAAEGLKHLTPEEMDYISNNVNSLGIEIIHSQDGFQINGLAKGVNVVVQKIQDSLLRQVRETEQDRIFAQVSWCIMGKHGIWERLPKEAHYQLENRIISGGIKDAYGWKWTVNMNNMEATEDRTKWVTKLKRLENLADFSLPLDWDSMAPGELLKVVPLQPGSAEYIRVRSDFKRTVQKAVIKIERVQNIHLRRAYEVRKKELQQKNGHPVGAGERILYHGTSEKSCSSIQNSRFDRGYAGQNAARYGQGSYFAMDASYSAQPTYSIPKADGTQLMFVARVLTGVYTQGESSLINPPPRLQSDPNNLFDSVVDNMKKPEMFVVFHDCQAYPDYLITFK